MLYLKIIKYHRPFGFITHVIFERNQILAQQLV